MKTKIFVLIYKLVLEICKNIINWKKLNLFLSDNYKLLAKIKNQFKRANCSKKCF